MLVYASAAALRLSNEWNLSYAELIPYATPGFIAFGVCAIPAGWIADKWSREGMMAIFFVGIGLSSVLAGFADSPFQMAMALTAIGVFAAIYHPVGLAMVVQGKQKTGLPLAINGVFGNLGVACAALITGFFIDASGWRLAFVLPGTISILIGLLYIRFITSSNQYTNQAPDTSDASAAPPPATPEYTHKRLMTIFAVIFFTTAMGGLIFQSTTFALPKILDERFTDLSISATRIGQFAFLIFAVAAMGQLIVGFLLDRLSLRLVFSSVALIQAIFFAAMTQVYGMTALLIAIAFMLAVFGQIPINDVLVGRITKSAWRSRAYGMRYVVSFSVMATTVPFIAWTHAKWGFDALFMILAVTAMSIFLATLLLPKLKQL